MSVAPRHREGRRKARHQCGDPPGEAQRRQGLVDRTARAAAPRRDDVTVLCGLGIFQTPNDRNMLPSAPRSRSGAAGGLQGMARLMGQTAGAVLTTVPFAAVPAGAPRVGLGLGAALALAAGLVSAARAPRERAS